MKVQHSSSRRVILLIAVTLSFICRQIDAQDKAGLPAGEPTVTQDPSVAKSAEPSVLQTNRQIKTDLKARVIACSPEGELVAVANGNPSLRMLVGGARQVKDQWQPRAQILDCNNGKRIAELDLNAHGVEQIVLATPGVSHVEVHALAFSPGADLLAVGTSIGQIMIFDAGTGKLVRTLDDESERQACDQIPEQWQPLQRGMGVVRSLAFSPNGSLLVSAGDTMQEHARVFGTRDRMGRRVDGPGRLKAWDVATGALKHDIAAHSYVQSVAFSLDGQLMASAGNWSNRRESGTGAIIWNAETGEELKRFTVEANGGAQTVAFSPDANHLVINSLRFDRVKDTKHRVLVSVDVQSGQQQWRRESPKLERPLDFYMANVAVMYDPAGIRLLDHRSGKILMGLRTQASARGVAFNGFATARRGNMIVFGGFDESGRGVVEIWDF